MTPSGNDSTGVILTTLSGVEEIYSEYSSTKVVIVFSTLVVLASKQSTTAIEENTNIRIQTILKNCFVNSIENNEAIIINEKNAIIPILFW